jgi:hypothetical protein
MSHGSDKRLSSYAWQKFAKRILRRDRHACQWRLDGCTDYATDAEHIIPRAWDAGGFMDEDNVVASCGHCNRKRPHLKPGEYGAYGTRPRGRDALKAPFFRDAPNARGGLGNLSLQRHTARWTVTPADYSRRSLTTDGVRRKPLIAKAELG